MHLARNESDDAMSRMNGAYIPRISAALLAAALLAGCATTNDTVSTLFVAPGDYDLYSCPQLQQTAGSLRGRRDELQGLMAKAETDAAGKFMSTLGYRPDYLRVTGELHELEKVAREKKCDLSAVPVKRTPTLPAPPSSRAGPGLVKPR